jgi:hypothetical protein
MIKISFIEDLSIALQLIIFIYRIKKRISYKFQKILAILG